VKGGGILFGTDHTQVAPEQASGNEPSKFITRFMCTEVEDYWGRSLLRVTHHWTGTTGSSPDKFPVVGVLDGNGLLMLGGFSGAGSAISFNAGRHIVFHILGKQCIPEYHPPQYFSPARFTDPDLYGSDVEEHKDLVFEQRDRQL
jgi:glycine/D-amino acid oxidase-like deaminating enzyme